MEAGTGDRSHGHRTQGRDRERAAELGLDDYTIKPLSEAICKEFLEKMLDPLFMAEKRRRAPRGNTE